MLRNVAQVALAATTLTDVLVGANFGMAGIHLKSLVVCNRSGASATFRLSIALNGEADANKQYIFYDLPLVPNDSFTSALDIGLSPADTVRAYASTANLSVNLFGE